MNLKARRNLIKHYAVEIGMPTKEIAIKVGRAETTVRKTLINYWNYKLAGQYIVKENNVKDFSQFKKIEVCKGTTLLVHPDKDVNIALADFKDKYKNTIIGKKWN